MVYNFFLVSFLFFKLWARLNVCSLLLADIVGDDHDRCLTFFNQIIYPLDLVVQSIK